MGDEFLRRVSNQCGNPAHLRVTVEQVTSAPGLDSANKLPVRRLTRWETFQGGKTAQVESRSSWEDVSGRTAFQNGSRVRSKGAAGRTPLKVDPDISPGN